MLLDLFLYFFLSVAMLALLCLLPVRDRTRQLAAAVFHRGRISGRAWRQTSGRRALARAAQMRAVMQAMAEPLQRHVMVLAATVVVVAVAPIGAAMLHSKFRIDSFDPHAGHPIDQRIAALLEGEDLVQPPTLPPDIFNTPEVEQWQPLVRSASRQWDLLDPVFRQRLLLAFRLLRQQYGYDMVLIEGYRSPGRQATLMSLGPSVTRAGPFESYHQFGLAADCAFLRDGHIVISEKDPWAMAGYVHYGEVARSLGLVWGGDWHGLRDLGHVELHRFDARVVAPPS